MRAGPFPVVVNHRGRHVPVVLGALLAATLLPYLLIAAAIEHGPDRRLLLWTAAGAAAVFGAGLYDDLRPERTRGLVRQLREATRGRVTSGVVKLVVIVAASAAVAWMLGLRGARFALAVPVAAGATNVWNLLDVVPGRALKAFLPAVLGVGLAAGGAFAAEVAVPAAAAAVVLLVLDLLEHGMLGDAGANVLGFVVGVGLLLSLSTPGLVVALVVVLALHALSETVTLSRVVDAAPPLRWLDRLGRAESVRPGKFPRQSDGADPNGATRP